MLTDFLLALGTKWGRYQTAYPKGVEDRTHLVARDFHSLLQELLVDYGAL